MTEPKVVRTWQGNCEDCNNWVFGDSGKGYCGVYSIKCITKVFNHEKPTRFLSRYDVPIQFGGLAEDEDD